MTEMDTKWTVVQHSGFGYKGDTTFAKALESRMAQRKVDQKKILRVGGVLFDSYKEAEDFCDTAAGDGPVPAVKGTFSDKMIDGLAIYIPLRQVLG